MNGPINIWPNMTNALEPHLKWLVENQARIVEVWPAKPMPKTRPIKFWPDGRVRVEFVGTFQSAAHAYAVCLAKVANCSPIEKGGE